ncbi:prephenate dehydratase [Thiohalorhabdus denitrificans]|uniref:Bifunctional chorismate mutase/prephenate dehydratase n=1 Tax=Thiohalorhabdus denitrificans TaxID=381306 RepID=A0A0P9CB14_9GAMM|nr:prephenate dehydratase [Thiohalorhabdus denitrificans]KPV40164.1 prephenate dehydratase [Thiohalorhabdus denitrificans]SCY18262.1 chorismate mutase [Thiohalorhabdus denitrificans]
MSQDGPSHNGESDGRQEELRQEIDRLDAEVQRLINQRAARVLEIARIKESNGGPFYRPEREAQILARVAERNEGPFPDEDMVRIFREVMSSCLALERRLRIAFLGPEASFTHTAVQVHFGHAVEEHPVAAIAEVFREVEAGTADYGVVPVENSTEGVVNATLDQLMRTSLQICGEVALRVEHHLMSHAGSIGAIQRLYVHPQTRAQCREWLHAHLDGVEWVEVPSNAEAARRASQEPESAAVAGAAAAELYELPILAAGIEDEPDNTTRFVVVGEEGAGVSGNDKTSIVISAPNRPGSLFQVLQPFSRAGVNLTKIVSRPARSSLWEYVFFLDLEGHREEPTVQKALEGVTEGGAAVKVLGSYPRAR